MAANPLTDSTSLPQAELAHRDWPYRRSAAMRYGIALLAVMVAFSMRYLIYGDLNNRLAFTFFVPAAMLAVWYGGLGPGMVATVLGLVVGTYFFILPRTDGAFGVRELMAVSVYTVTTMLCVALCEHLHHCIRRIEHALGRERHTHASALQDAQGGNAFQADAAPAFASPFRRPALTRYGSALGVVLIAFGLRYWMFGVQDHRFPFLMFVPAALVATWYGGMAPGLVATVAGLMLGDYFFLSEHAAMGPVRDAERLAIGFYAGTTTLCVLLIENLHNHVRRVEHALEHARQAYLKLHPVDAAR